MAVDEGVSVAVIVTMGVIVPVAIGVGVIVALGLGTWYMPDEPILPDEPPLLPVFWPVLGVGVGIGVFTADSMFKSIVLPGLWVVKL